MAKSFALGMNEVTATTPIFTCNGSNYTDRDSDERTPIPICSATNNNDISIKIADENGNALPGGTTVQVTYIGDGVAYSGELTGDTNVTINAAETNERILHVTLKPFSGRVINGTIVVTTNTPKQNSSTATLTIQ